MFVDIHVHVQKHPGVLRNGKPCFASPQQLIERYDAVGIEAGVLLPMVHVECNYVSQSNEEILEIVETYPGRFIPFCNIDPRAMTNSADAPLGDLLRHYRDKGCKGVGEVCANLPFLDPLVQNLFKHVEDAGMPLTCLNNGRRQTTRLVRRVARAQLRPPQGREAQPAEGHRCPGCPHPQD